MPAPRIVIVGAGMAGLAAAWECHRRGLRPLVLESAPRVGGVVTTRHEEGLVLDGGPDAFLYTKPGARVLCDELSLGSELVETLPPRGAFILAGDAFHALPEGGALGVPVRARSFASSRLLSWRGKLRVASEPFRPRRRARDGEDESAGAFFRRRFGDELAERLAQPLLGGIHAGRLDALSAQAVIPTLVAIEQRGASVWLTLRRQASGGYPGGVFRSFARGMARLPQALEAALPAGCLQTGAAVTRLRRAAGGFALELREGAPVEADIVLLTVPAWQAMPLLGDVAAEAAELCGTVPYVSTATALLAYPAAAFPTPGRGSGYVIAQRDTDDPVMAVTWVTGKWPGRAPAGTVLVRVFFGGAGHEDVLALDDAALVAAGHAHLARWWGAGGPPPFARVFRWMRASPQHTVGHPQRVRTIGERLDLAGTLGVAGSGFRAIGIPDVVADARAEMARLLTRWGAS